MLCNDVLEKWEPEFSYLNVSVKELYDVVTGIASGSLTKVNSSGVDWMFDTNQQ